MHTNIPIAIPVPPEAQILFYIPFLFLFYIIVTFPSGTSFETSVGLPCWVASACMRALSTIRAGMIPSVAFQILAGVSASRIKEAGQHEHVHGFLHFCGFLHFSSSALCGMPPRDEAAVGIRTCHFVAGKTLSIVGYGDIGKACGRLAKAFGMKILALRRNPTISEEEKAAGVLSEVFAVSDLHRMLQECDYVVMAMPFTPQTHKFFDAAAFAAMKSTAVFINIGRGKTVDEDALVDALQNGKYLGSSFYQLTVKTS